MFIIPCIQQCEEVDAPVEGEWKAAYEPERGHPQQDQLVLGAKAGVLVEDESHDHLPI